MKRVLVMLVTGAVLSGVAAAWATSARSAVAAQPSVRSEPQG